MKRVTAAIGKYEFRPTRQGVDGKAPISLERAQRYGARLVELQRDDGQIHPEDIVEDARSPKSPLHDWFEWSDKKRAEQGRLQDARYLLSYIDIVEVTTNERVRAFVTTSKLGYRHTPSIISNVDAIKEIYQGLLREIQHFQEQAMQWKKYLDAETILARKIETSLSRRIARRKSKAA